MSQIVIISTCGKEKTFMSPALRALAPTYVNGFDQEIHKIKSPWEFGSNDRGFFLCNLK